MKKPIALMLISIMVLMLSAFSFADDGYSMKIMEPKKTIADSEMDEPFFITVWVKANIDDKLESLDVTILDGEGNVDWSENVVVDHEFITDAHKFTFEAVDFTPMDKFEIFVVADFADDEIGGVEDSKMVTVKTDKEKDKDKDKDDDVEMENDNYPAAPAIANKLLKEAGIPNRVGNINLIEAVSEAMNEDEEFEGIEKDDTGYADEVEEFLFEKLNEILDENGIGELDFDDDELSDFVELIANISKTIEKTEVNKIDVEITELKNNNKGNDNEEEEEDDDDEDEDDEDDDDEDDENNGKGKKK